MTSFKRGSLTSGDLPPTIVADVQKAYDAEHKVFKKFWQITLKITDACGLRCTYCTQYVEKNPIELSAEFLSEFVNFVDAKSLSCGFLLTGGEPLHHKDFYGAIRPFSESCTPFDVNSSLVASQSTIETLISAKPRTIRFSLHSVNATESSAFNGTDSWKTIVKNAALVANGANRPQRVEINTHLSTLNYKDTLKRLTWIASQFDVDDINIFPVYDFKPMHLNQEQMEEYYNDILPGVIEFASSKNFHGLKTRAMRLLGDPIHGRSEPKYVDHHHNCHAGRSILYVDNFRDVYPCVSQQIHRANTSAKRIGTLLSAPELEDLITRTPELGFDPNENDVCVKHCPLFFSMVNQYVEEH